MDADMNDNDGRSNHAADGNQAPNQQQNEGRSSEDFFFDYSDAEDQDDNGTEFQEDSTRVDGENDGIMDENPVGAHQHSQEVRSSVLDRHIQRMDWPAVLGRIKSHPRECFATDSTTGQTPLHVACRASAPAVVIQTLCQAYPEASTRTDRCNMNPLHICCSSDSASLNTVHALLRHGLSEQVSMRDVDGDTPLHAACRCGAHEDVIDVLVQAYKGAIHVRDYEGLTPLVRLWVRYYVILGETFITRIIRDPDCFGTDRRFYAAWDQTLLLLRYAHYGEASLGIPSSGSFATLPTSIYATSSSLKQQIQSSNRRLLSPTRNTDVKSQTHLRSLPIVHAAAAVDCPRFVVQIAMKRYPSQLLQRDEHGRTPLMIACGSPIYPYHNLSDESCCSTTDSDDGVAYDYVHDYNYGYDDDDEEIVRRIDEPRLNQQHATASAIAENSASHSHPNSDECKPSVIELILQGSRSAIGIHEDDQLNPEQKDMMRYGGADWVDPSGRLPLHIAIDSGKTWVDGVEALIKAYPESISISDRSTKLFPYQLAATKAIHNDHISNDCYELLRLNPSVLSMDCRSNSGTSLVDSSFSSSINEVVAASTDTHSFTPRINRNDVATINDKHQESIQRKKRKL